MWRCAVCKTEVEDESWSECWKCGASRTLDTGTLEKEKAGLAARLAKASLMQCLRCETKLEYLGTKRFHEGTRQWGFWLGNLGELFVHRQTFDVYACPICGKVEMFVDGVGEHLRPQENDDRAH